MIGARAAAVQVLVTLERGDTTLADELDRARVDLPDRRDRGLLFEITAGTLRWRAEIDALLAPATRRPLADLDPPIRALLRLGAYQLRHLDRVPPHAVVHESVETAKKIGQAHAAGFVNAVLRAVASAHKKQPLPQRPAKAGDRAGWLAYLATTMSHPEWLVARWLDRYGPDPIERWCLFNNTAPRVTLRLRRGVDRAAILDRLAAADVPAEPAGFVANAVHVLPGGSSRLPDDVRDVATIQDEGSQLVGEVAAACGGERVVDLCAAPGGKTLILAGEAAPGRLVVGCDFRPARVALLRSIVARAGVQIPVVRLDAAAPLPFAPDIDTVLLDAPCSGLGTLRRDPDLKWARQPADLERLAATELQMLGRAAAIVKPGGVVVYATCSSEPEENEHVVGRFLQAHPQFRMRRATFPAHVSHGDTVLDDDGCLRTLPFRDGIDAFFAAVLERTDGGASL